jgi:hypothetical protein
VGQAPQLQRYRQAPAQIVAATAIHHNPAHSPFATCK